MKTQQHVYVAMSGGVDSAVTAVRLIELGFQVTGIFMRTWKDRKLIGIDDDADAPERMAAAVAESIGIPFVIKDVQDRFFNQVVQEFIHQYLHGQTPNPCLFCNPQIKWGILQSYALEQGADFFATGHYARILADTFDRVKLARGIDSQKDQSYVLSMLSQAQLKRSLLPLGELTKKDVRVFAQERNLIVANRQDSQDLCFLGNIDYRDFLQRYAPEVTKPGEIVNTAGQVLGQHFGLSFYTIGQRKGIHIAATQPYYVVDKDFAQNRLIVGFSEQAQKSNLIAVQANWISGEPPNVGEAYQVMVRYRAVPVTATLISATEEEFRLELEQPLRGITPGQVSALYQGETCLGGGVIISSW